MCDFLLQSFVSAVTLLPLCTKTPQGRLTLQTKQLHIGRHQRPELKMDSARALPRKYDFHGSFSHYFTVGSSEFLLVLYANQIVLICEYMYLIMYHALHDH